MGLSCVPGYFHLSRVRHEFYLRQTKKKGMFMKRLFGGATLLFAAISADAGLIRADFRAGYQLNDSDFLSNDSRWDKGEASLGLDPALATIPSPAATGITFLTETPAADATSMPEPATLAFIGLGAGALGLARQGKGKRA
jgi:hypothetical protein